MQDNVKDLKGLPSWLQSEAGNTIKFLQRSLAQIGESMQVIDMQKLGRESDFRVGRPLLDSLMATLAGVLLLKQAAWRHDDSTKQLRQAVQLTADQDTRLEDVEAARLWVEGGHGDLERTLATLKRLTAPSGSSSVGSSKLGQLVVYGLPSSRANL